MKYLSYFLVAILFVACAGSKNRLTRQPLSGVWLLQTINTEGITGNFKEKILNEAQYTCFIGSTWNFDSSTYKLDGNSKECPALTRKIQWTIYDPPNVEKELHITRLDAKNNPMDSVDYYNFKIASIENKSMQLRTSTEYEGQQAAVVFNFVRK